MITKDLVCRVGKNKTQTLFLLKTVEDFLYMPGPNPDEKEKVAAKVLPEDYISKRGMLIPKGEWVQRPLTETELKLRGVEFEGVMCSLCAEDQWGLASIRPYVQMGMPIKYEFKNGNKLLLTQGNMTAFESVWLPARAAFFPTN